MIILKATLHTLRDRISIAESFDLMAQLPLVLKGVYVEHWRYKETPEKYDTFKEFTEKIEREQNLHGEIEFDWSKSTGDIVGVVIRTLNSRYLSDGQLAHILKNLPQDISENLNESVYN